MVGTALRVEHLDELDAEIQLLARHLVIGVEGDGRIVLGDDLHREGLAVLILQIDLLADRDALRTGELCDLDGEDGVGILLTIGIMTLQGPKKKDCIS